MNYHSMIATAKRNLITKKRAYPIEFFIGSYLNLFFLIVSSYIIYKFIFNGQISSEFAEYSKTDDYLSYVIIGAIIYLFVVRTFINVGRSFISEIREGTIEPLLITPFSPSLYLSGVMLEQTLLTVIEGMILFLTIVGLGFNFYAFDVLSFLLVLMLSFFSFFGMAVILGGIMVYLKDTFIVQNTAFAVINLLIGVSFPIEYLPQVLQKISLIIPATHSLELLRSIMLTGGTIYSNLDQFLLLLILSVVYCGLGLYLIKFVVYKSIENQFI